MTALWGEYETPDVLTDELLPGEVVKLFVMRAMSQEPLQTMLTFPQQSQESEDPNSTVSVNPETVGLRMDERVLHTIKLMQHANEMKKLVEALKDQVELMEGSQIHTFPPAIPIPPAPDRKPLCRINYPIPHLNKEFSDFTLGKGPEIPEITLRTAKTMLKKSVAALLAHTGYHTTKESVLNTLSDVAEEYIKKMTLLLRVAVDQGANVKATGFPDAIERMFHDMNIGSIRSIHTYYQNRVLKYHQKMMEKCKSLNNEYNNIISPVKNEVPTPETITKMEVGDIPEIHFPELPEEPDMEELQPLDHSYDAFQNLEREVRELYCANDEVQFIHVPIEELLPPESHLTPAQRTK